MGRALFVGRFQPFHHGHFEVVKKLLAKHDELIMVIGSAEISFTEKNPFTAGERVQMIRSSFGQEELSRLMIIPIRDINNHSLWVSHVMSHVPDFDAAYSNNPLVKQLFSNAGVEVQPVEFIDRGNKEGKFIRKLMAEGNPEWKKHVPDGVAEVIEKIKGVGRLKQIIA